MNRIFICAHVTQLMVIQHLRRHLTRAPAREYLLWMPLNGVKWTDEFMRTVIPDAGFDGTLDIRNLEFLAPRTHGATTWWFESARRLGADATTIRTWMKNNQIVEGETELWSDDPLGSNTVLVKGLLRKARQIKFPHCFNLEDASSNDWKDRFLATYRAAPRLKRWLFWPWLRWVSGVDWQSDRELYEFGYTFDQPSSWAETSVDASGMITTEAFRQTYETLPAKLKESLDRTLAPVRAGRRPLIVLLLFEMNAGLQQAYQDAIGRIFSQRKAELEGCSLAVKVHPAASGENEESLFRWLESSIPAKVFPIRSVLNVEFILPQLSADYICAGPCGALPTVKRLGGACPIVLPEVTEFLCHVWPESKKQMLQFQDEIGVW